MFRTNCFEKAYRVATYKVDFIRNHLNGVYVHFDVESNTLNFVGTDAQVMYVFTEQIENKDDIELYTNMFSVGKTLSPLAEFKPKKTTEYGSIEKQGEFYLIDKQYPFKELEDKYPDYKQVIPHGTKEPTEFAMFHPRLINKVDTIMGCKKSDTILNTIPKMESKTSPAVWDFNSRYYKEKWIVMPMNIDYLQHQDGVSND